MGVGQGGKNRPLTPFEDLRFEASSEAFGLRVVVVIAASALRTQCAVAVKQGAVGVATVLPAAFSMHDQPRDGGLREQRPLQVRGGELFGHGGGHMPADHVLGEQVLKGA